MDFHRIVTASPFGKRKMFLTTSPRLLVWIAFALGTAIRISFVMIADFPIHDGGMFFMMIRDLENNKFVLPTFTSYNFDQIPYAYPPLPFYVAGLLDKLTPLDLMDIIHYLPVIITTMTIPVFYMFSRNILPSDQLVNLSVFAYIFIPYSFRWLIMGGGLTRSFGALFSLLALTYAFLTYKKQQYRYVIPAVFFSGLTVLSHPENAWFLFYSIGFGFLFFDRTKQGILRSIVLFFGTFVLIAPWIITVVARHGLALLFPFTDSGFVRYSGVEQLLLLKLSDSYLVPIWSLLGLLGLVLCIANKNYFIPVWFFLIFILQPRAADQRAVIPLALLAGIGVKEILCVISNYRLDRLGLGTLKIVISAFLLFFSVVSVYMSPIPVMTSLSPYEREAMEWIDLNTSTASSILVIPPSSWPIDHFSEWVPVLANRPSVAVVQGYEWTNQFSDRISNHKALQKCTNEGIACLNQWIKDTDTYFTHIYIPKACIDYYNVDQCGTLRVELRYDPRYRAVYDGPGATIYEKGEE